MTANEQGAGPAGQPPSYPGEPRLAYASLLQVRADWIRFYDAHYHPVIGFVMKNGASLDDAQDAAQEAFTASWQLMHTRPDTWLAITSKPAWIRTVALRAYRRPPGPRRCPPIATVTDMPDLPGSRARAGRADRPDPDNPAGLAHP